MHSDIKKLHPTSVWTNFSNLNAVPRPSKKEERVIQFIKNFGESLSLETNIDHIGNVIIKKAGTAGKEDNDPIILQSHLDMVCQKNNDTVFDFETEGIKMYIDEDWVKAEGTTLGADNGMGVAAIMALLESTEIAHPPLEALFTIDEETGMTGAFELKPGLLKGKTLLNLDSEDDEEITIGCAGGIDITLTKSYVQEAVSGSHQAYKLTVKGLKGGHSGMDIHKGRGNANKLLNRLLWTASKTMNFHIGSIDGGSLRNAIPREASAVLLVLNTSLDAFKSFISDNEIILKKEHRTTDPNLELLLKEVDAPFQAMPKTDQNALMDVLYACHNGIYRMSPDIEGLVQTSNNLARVLVENGKILIQCLTRSSLDSEKADLSSVLEACFTPMGATVSRSGAYPGWTPEPKAKINKVLSDKYAELFGHQANITACHAGLECGIIKKSYPDVDMISFGPNIRGAHSPDERVQISSVQKFWKLLLSVLEEL